MDCNTVCPREGQRKVNLRLGGNEKVDCILDFRIRLPDNLNTWTWCKVTGRNNDHGALGRITGFGWTNPTSEVPIILLTFAFLPFIVMPCWKTK